MKLTSKSMASLKNLFVVIVTFAMGSIVINLQSVRYTRTGGSDVISLQQHDVARQIVLTGSDVRGFGRSLNQHPDVQSREPEIDAKLTLLMKLMQIEERLRKHVSSPAVALIGNHGNEDFLSSVTLKDHKLQIVNTDEEDWRLTRLRGNWSVMFCSDTNHCPTDTMDISQKADMIPELLPFVSRPSRLCDIARSVHRSDVKKPCCVLDVHVDLPDLIESTWFVETENGTAGYLRSDHGCNSNEIGLVLWRLPSSPVVYEAGPVLRLQALVTSLMPLRLYVSSKMQSGPFTSLHDETSFKKTSLGGTLHYISELYGLGTSSRWWSEVQDTVLKYLEHMESGSDVTLSRCGRCFHVLWMDVACHSIGQCSILKVTDGRHISAEYFNSVLPIVSLSSRVAENVNRDLEDISQLAPLECEGEASYLGCLSEDDLQYIIDDNLEAMNLGDWIKVYPFAEEHVTNPSLSSPSHWLGMNAKYRHAILIDLQKLYKNSDTHNQEFADRDPTSAYFKDEGMERSTPKQTKDDNQHSDCSFEKDTYGKITTIGTRPALGMEELSAGQFFANVSYNTIMVKLWTSAAHCNCDVRLENKYNTPGSKHIILGLGETVIRIYVVDKDRLEPSVVNVVMVTINRLQRGVTAPRRFHADTMAACGLNQECSLPFDMEQQCGLYSLDQTWSTFGTLTWQHCSEGDSPGRWIVPCTECSDATTCNWAHSRWQPNTCSYRQLSNSAVKQCLTRKKILFIGDSTNRGILNYMINRINGSLWNWDKTHSVKVYDNVNDNSTFLSFAYYPHFWLPVDHRPKFLKVIYQLIKSSLPLENNSNTVLVIGGVQWLARQHIDYIIEALQRKGLSNITKVVKGIGTGFHQPVEGVRFLPKTEHAKLAKKEQEVLNYSKQQGFKVVATFNMTMARYMDFLEGKCACHFHKVANLNSANYNGSMDKGRYSVTGEINAAYSDILIDQICD